LKLIWTEPAVLDLEKIKEYVSRDSEYYALNLIENIFESVEKLKEFPNIGRVVPEYQDKKLREILYYNYRIIYKVKDNQLAVLAIIHGAREISNQKP